MNELKEWHGEDISDINFTYPHKTQCPKCASEGGDRSGDNLHIYGLDDDGRSLGAYCFDEDTDVFTYNGIKKIKDLIGKQTRIVNGNAEWEEVVFRSYGFDEIYELEISSNMIKKTIKTTANHLWFVKNNEKCLRTDELKPRQYLIGGELPKKSFKLIKDAVAHGFVFGDGSLHWRGNSSAVPFYSKTKYAVYEYLKDADCVITVGVRKRDTEVMPNLTFRHDKYSFKSLPLLAESDDYLFSWLSGYFAADGCLHGTGSSILNSANKEHLEFVEKVCARLGIRTRKIKSQTRAEGKSFLRKGESTLYNIRFYTKDLPENFFIREAHKKPNVKYDRKAWKVLSVKKTGIIKEVYCCETSTQSFLLADYILTHNCFRCNFTVPSEEFLAEIGSNSFSGNFDKKGEGMISKRDEEKLKEKSLTPEQLAEIYDKTSDSLTTKYRGLDGNVAKELDVRWEYNADGSLKAMYFPAYVKDNGGMKVTGYKVRDLPKNFHSFGYVGKCNLMGGMTSQVAETLIVVAGEIELVTATQAMKSADKYRKSYNIVTSLTGESSTADDLKNHYEWVNKHQKIIICMDNDSAGEKAFDEIKKVVDNDKLYKANLRHKDLNDYLKNGDGDKIVNDLYWQAIPYENYGLIGSSDLFDKALDMVVLERIPLPPFLSGLDEAFSGGIALGEVVNIVSSVSTGKSVFVNEIVLDWIINSPYKMMIISLEDNGGSYLIKIASRIINNKIMTLRTADERKQALIDHRDEIDKYLVDEDGYNRFIFKEDSTSDLDIMKRAILQAIKVFGVRIILLDPLMSLIGSKSLDEQVKWMEFEEETRRIHNVTFINVAHTRKSSSGSQAHSEGGSISEEDIKGSQQISATATTNIILRRNKMAEDEIERNTTYVDITKNRTVGITGRDLARIYYSNKHHTLFDFNYAEQNNFFNDMPSEKLKEVIDFNKATPVSSSLDDVEELNDAMDASSLVSSIIPDW